MENMWGSYKVEGKKWEYFPLLPPQGMSLSITIIFLLLLLVLSPTKRSNQILVYFRKANLANLEHFNYYENQAQLNKRMNENTMIFFYSVK